MKQVNETAWMGKYRTLVERIICLCNLTATHFWRVGDYQTKNSLTAIQIQIIEYLLEDKDEKMIEIARRMGITRGAFSNNVTRIEKLGLVKKEYRNGNKKNLYLVVTPEGRAEYETYAIFIYEHAFKEMFEIADTIPEESIRSFESLLQTFINTLV